MIMLEAGREPYARELLRFKGPRKRVKGSLKSKKGDKLSTSSSSS
jgi:hypothetical protein